MHALEAVEALYVPAEQMKQSESSSWAVVSDAASIKYVPAGQSVQTLSIFAAAALYFPTPQTVQSETSSWAAEAVVASARYVPAGHDVQVAVAVVAAYFPAPHVTH